MDMMAALQGLASWHYTQPSAAQISKRALAAHGKNSGQPMLRETISLSAGFVECLMDMQHSCVHQAGYHRVLWSCRALWRGYQEADAIIDHTL